MKHADAIMAAGYRSVGRPGGSGYAQPNSTCQLLLCHSVAALTHVGGSWIDNQLCTVVLKLFWALPAAVLCWRRPTRAMAARAATAGTNTRKPMLACRAGLLQSRTQAVLVTQLAGAPPGIAGLKVLQIRLPHWY